MAFGMGNVRFDGNGLYEVCFYALANEDWGSGGDVTGLCITPSWLDLNI